MLECGVHNNPYLLGSSQKLFPQRYFYSFYTFKLQYYCYENFFISFVLRFKGTLKFSYFTHTHIRCHIHSIHTNFELNTVIFCIYILKFLFKKITSIFFFISSRKKYFLTNISQLCSAYCQWTPVVPWFSYSPLDPSFAGSNPAGVDGFLRAKNPACGSLRKRSQALVPCRIFTPRKRTSSRN